MAYIDPLKVMRNPETLAAYRSYQREVRAKVMPWWAIAAIAALTEVGAFLYALYRNGLHELGWVSGPLTLIFGLSFAIGSFRAWRFVRAHPFELP